MLESVIISTIAGSVICAALLMFKNKILSALGGKALYRISLIAMLIFVLPMNIGDIPFPKVPVKQIVNVTEVNVAEPKTDTANTPVQTVPQDISENIQYDNLPKATNMVRRSNPITVQEILIIIWLFGFVASMCRYFVSYFRFKNNICGFESNQKIDGVKVIKSPLVMSPMIFGFFKPTLAVPEFEMSDTDYELAIRHEMVHYKHHDSWFKLYAVFVNSVCWFNPVTYLMVNLIGEACEYACDEQVTNQMDMADKKQYSSMILSMVCQSSPALSSNMAKNKKQLKRRFEMIMKKKRVNVLKTALCMVIMLVLTCGSVALANGIEPIVSSLLKDDYVYVSTWGYNGYDKGHNELIPVEKNGEYYLPLREFMTRSDVENDKIKYDNGVITVDMWTDRTTAYSVGFTEGGQNASDVEDVRIIPAEYSWSTSCTIGSKEVEIAGEKYTLANAPYLEDGITYVPYEYLEKLKLYENKLTSINLPENKKRTSKFVSLLMFGFDSAKAEYYTDYVQMENLLGESSYSTYSSMTYNADARIAKTGYRTEFEASYNYFKIDDVEKEGSVKIKLNKVTRIYSKGSDLEGLFTVEIDGKTIYDNQKGNIIQLPIPAGEGVLDFASTRVKIGDLSIDVFFNGFDTVSDEYDKKAREVGKMSELPETVKKFIVPVSVKLNDKKVIRGSKTQSNLWFNKEKKLVDINIEFDNYNGDNGEEMKFYRIHSELDSKMSVIDENSFSAELYFTEGNNNRIDSFDAIITISPSGEFELKSTDGKYIIVGTAEEFVPQWEWSEEKKNAPVPQVVMITD